MPPCYCSGCFSEGPWPAETGGLCDGCYASEAEATLDAMLAEAPQVHGPTDFPRLEDGRLVWACCVSAVGPDCLHKIAA